MKEAHIEKLHEEEVDGKVLGIINKVFLCGRMRMKVAPARMLIQRRDILFFNLQQNSHLTTHIAKTDSVVTLFFVNTVRMAVFHLLNLALTKLRQSKCYDCQVNHPSQTQHPCSEPLEEDFLLSNYSGVIKTLCTSKFIQAIQRLVMLCRIKAEDSRVKTFAESMLS